MFTLFSKKARKTLKTSSITFSWIHLAFWVEISTHAFMPFSLGSGRYIIITTILSYTWKIWKNPILFTASEKELELCLSNGKKELSNYTSWISVENTQESLKKNNALEVFCYHLCNLISKIQIWMLWIFLFKGSIVLHTLALHFKATNNTVQIHTKL